MERDGGMKKTRVQHQVLPVEGISGLRRDDASRMPCSSFSAFLPTPTSLPNSLPPHRFASAATLIRCCLQLEVVTQQHSSSSPLYLLSLTWCHGGTALMGDTICVSFPCIGLARRRPHGAQPGVCTEGCAASHPFVFTCDLHRVAFCFAALSPFLALHVPQAAPHSRAALLFFCLSHWQHGRRPRPRPCKPHSLEFHPLSLRLEVSQRSSDRQRSLALCPLRIGGGARIASAGRSARLPRRLLLHFPLEWRAARVTRY